MAEVHWPNAYITSYNWWDNNPPHSDDIAFPSTFHGVAGGLGTYNDPITVAADYSSGTTMQFAPGTRFYIPHVRCYFIVEDLTGEQQDDNTASFNTNPHLDMWSDGRTSTESNAAACMSSITAIGVLVIEDPASNYVVDPGPLSQANTCHATYSDTLVVVSGTGGMVGRRPPAFRSLIKVPSLWQPGNYGLPGVNGGGVTTAIVPSLWQPSTYGTPTLSSGSIGGFVVPDLHTDPAATRIAPVTGQPGPSAVDSTQGLQAFIDSTPSNATIILPFDLVCNDTIHVRGSRKFRTSDPVNGKKRIIRTLSYPWRVRPDQRATIGGNPNPGYHPDMRCSTWQYDWRGGKLQEPFSLTNPYGMNADGSSKAAGTDNGGFDANDGSNATGPNANTYDGHHLVALDATTIGSSGGPNGNGTWPGISGALWLNSDVGKVLRVLLTGGEDRGAYQNVVTSVTNAGRRIDWASGGAVIKNVVAVGTMCWCIHYKDASWELYFTPNPGFRSTYFAAPGWNNFDNAMRTCFTENDNLQVQLHDTATISGIELVGPNNGVGVAPSGAPTKDDINARNTILAFSTSNPMKSEFQNALGGDNPLQTVDNCDVHHVWGDCVTSTANLQIPKLQFSAFHSTGRQGINLSGYDNVTIDHCEFGDHRHSMADIEGSPAGVNTNVRITNNTMYGPHGMSWTSTVNGFTFTGNHSTVADVNAHAANTWQHQCGLCLPTRSGEWQPKPGVYQQSQNVNVSNNNFDDPVQLSAPPSAFVFGNCTNVTVRNNHGKVAGTRTHYYWQPYQAANKSDLATNYSCTGNTCEDASNAPVTAQVAP